MIKKLTSFLKIYNFFEVEFTWFLQKLFVSNQIF